MKTKLPNISKNGKRLLSWVRDYCGMTGCKFVISTQPIKDRNLGEIAGYYNEQVLHLGCDPTVNPRGFLMVACHEVAHLMQKNGADDNYYACKNGMNGMEYETIYHNWTRRSGPGCKIYMKNMTLIFKTILRMEQNADRRACQVSKHFEIPEYTLQEYAQYSYPYLLEYWFSFHNRIPHNKSNVYSLLYSRVDELPIDLKIDLADANSKTIKDMIGLELYDLCMENRKP